MKKRLLSLLLCAMCVLAAHSEVTYILNEGFESGIPATWSQQVMSTNTQNWVAENSNLTNPNGAFAGTGRVAFRNTTGNTQAYVTRLVTPVLTLPYGRQYELKFAYATPAKAGDVDSLTVYYSTDGTKWTKHTGYGTAQNSWAEVSLDLIGNGSTYQLAFEAFDKVGGGIVLDAVRVLPKSECADVENFAADARANSVELSWTGDFGATFQLIVDTVSHTLADLDPAGQYLHYEATTNDMVTVSGLLSEHTYYAYVRSLCDDNESGFTAWKAVEFRTAIGFPYQADLSAMPAGWQNLYGLLDGDELQPNTTSYKWSQTTSTAFGDHLYGRCYYDYSSSPSYQPSWFVSPAVDISTLAEGTPVELTFNLSISSSETSMSDIYASYQATSFLYVMVSTDGGQSWVQQKVCPATTYMSALRRVRVNLNEYVGAASSVKVALVVESSSYYSVYFNVSNIKVDTYDAQCGDISSISATDVTTNSAKLVWTVFGKDSVLVELSKSADFATLVGSYSLNDASHELSLTSLDNSTAYYVRAKQLCADAEWATCSFSTLFSMSLVENFDAISSGVPAGWNNAEGTTTTESYRWSSTSSGLSGRGLVFNSYYNSNGNTNYLKSPNVLIGEEQVKLAFDYKNVDGGQVLLQYSLDGGKTKQTLDSLGNTNWKHFEYVLADTLRNKSLMIIFFATSNYRYSGNEPYAYLDNFQMRPYDPHCLGLSTFVAEAEINEAVLSWTVGGSIHEALVHVSTKADFSDTLLLTEVSGVDTLLLKNLESDAFYYARAIQNCGGYIWVDAFTTIIKTHCAPDTIPYVMNFEAETNKKDPACWTIIRAEGDFPYVNQGSSYAHAGTKALFYGNKAPQSKSIAALPVFDTPVDTLEMSFWLRADNEACTNTLEVGVMTNPLDTNTFVRIASFRPKSTTYEQQIVSFNGYKGNGRYIVFRNPATGNYGFCIDDIDVHVLSGCFRVGEVEVTEVTGQGASLYFAPTNAESYQVVVATKAINVDSLHVDSIAAAVVYNELLETATGNIVLDSAALFQGNTTYYVYVRGVCSETERGAWCKPVVFTTNCRPFTPVEFGTDGFNDPVGIACWKFGFTTEGNTTSSSKAQRTASLLKFGNVIQLTKESGNSYQTQYNDGAYAVTPEFAVGDSIDKFQITFSAATNKKDASNVGQLVVAIVSSQSAISSMQEIQTINLPYAADSTQLSEYSVSFENYYGDYMGRKGHYVMFLSVAGEDSTNYVVLDNVRLEPISSCKRVNETTISNVTSNGATFTWQNVGNAQYEVLVSTVFTKNVDTIAAPAFTATVDTCRALLSGLNGNTQYYAYVRGVCGADDKGVWSNAAAFRTECEAIASFPWSENFETFSSGNLSKDCWTNEHFSGSGSSAFQISSDEVGNNSTKMLKLPYTFSTYQARLELPLINIPEADAYEFKLDMYRATGSNPNDGIIVLAEYGQQQDTLLWIPRAFSQATATVEAEAAIGWYTYGVKIPFSGDGHIVLVGSTQSNNYNDSYADNLYIRELPKCENPKAITVDSTTETGARVHWYGVADRYEVIIMNDNALVDSVVVTDTVYNFTNLSVGTAYSYTMLLRGMCGSDPSDVIVKTLNFTTTCGVKSLPFAETFESYKTGTFAGLCWTNVPVAGDSTGFFTVSSSFANGGKQSLSMPLKKVGTITHLTSPEFDIPAGEPVELSIDVYRNATGTSFTTEGVRLFALNGTDSVELGFLYRNFTQTDSNVVVAEAKAGWYTYAFTLPNTISGATRILLQGESQNGAATYMDNLKLRRVPTCFPGTNLRVVDSLATATSVAFAWTPNSADNLNAHVIVKDRQLVLVDSLINDSVFVLNGLEASHRYTYSVEVATVCEAEESVDVQAATLTFATECTPLATPWSIDFAETTSSEMPVCWTVVKKNSDYPKISTSSHGIYMSGGGSNTSLMFALPEFSAPLNTLTLTMQYLAGVSSSYGKLIVGTLDETLAESSFVALDTLDQVTNKTDYELILSSAPASAKYLAVRYASGSSDYGTAYIYNMALDLTPACLPLKNLEAKHVERRSMDIVLTPKMESDAFDLVISTVALTDSALNAAEKIVLDTTVYHAEGLTRNTVYYIYARVNCGAEDGVGPWMTISQKTPALQHCGELVVADGVASSNYYPIYGYYCDAQQKSQSIYPASMLESLVGSTITGMQYFVRSGGSAGSWDEAEFTISVGTTSTSTMGSELLDEALLDVYTGTLSASVADGMSISFDQPFVYNGGNLVVQFELVEPDSYANCEFFGVDYSNNVSRYEYSYFGSSTGSTSKFLPKVGFNYCVSSVPCPAVETVSHELLGDGTSSARISWTASKGDYASSYSVVYADSLITDWSNVVPQFDSIQVLDTVISGLEAYTNYYVYVIAHCDGEGHNDGSSVWSEVHRFKTFSHCRSVEDFSFVATGKTSAKATWSAPFADKNFVYVLSTEYLDEEALETVTPVAYTDTVLSLESLTLDQTYYLYVAHYCGGEDGLSPYMMDSIRTSAACPAVANLRVAASTAYTFTLAWNRAPFGEETEWEVGVVGRESLAQVVTDSTAVIFGLDPDMDYTVYVKSICGVGEESAPAKLSVHTKEVVSGGTTVGDGNETNAFVPVYGYYVDAGVYSESMYRSSLLEEINGADITGVKFYSSGDASWSGASFNVYLQETDADNEEDFVASGSEAVLVYQGGLSTSADDGMVINFTQPYSYSGRNLVLIVSQTVAGSYQSVYFYGSTQTYKSSYYETDYSSGIYTFLPKTDFFVEEAECPGVKALKASDLTINSANISWMPGAGETSWAVVFADSAQTAAQLAAAQPDTLNYQLDTVFSGLTPETEYHVYVRSLCSSAVADWKHLSFTTLPTCSAPIELEVKELADTTAVLAWENMTVGFAGDYTVAFGKAATFKLGVDSTYTLYEGLKVDTLALTGLESNTLYSFAVMEVCTATDSSRWSEVYSFRTECSIVKAFPWVENFDSLPTGLFADYCWTNEAIVSSSSYSDNRFRVTSGGMNSTNGLYSDLSYYGDVALMALPVMYLDSTDTYQFVISVNRNTESSYYAEEGLHVYVSNTDTLDASAVELGFISRVYNVADAAHGVPAEANTGWYDYYFDIPRSGNVRIILRPESQGSYNYLYVDNFKVRVRPNCERPVIKAATTTLTSAEVLVSGSSERYIVELSNAANFAKVDTVYATSDTIRLSQLISGKTYYIRVTGDCDGELSDASTVFSFMTKCGLPFSEDFEAATTMPNGWSHWLGDLTNLSATTSGWTMSTYSSYGGLTPNYISSYVYNSSYSTTPYKYLLATPEIYTGVEDGTAIELTFDVALTDSYGDTVTTTTSDNREFSVVVSTDGGNSWSRVASWMNDGNMGTYGSLPSTSTTMTVDLSGFTNTSIKLGLYHSIGTSTSDKTSYVRVDNINVHGYNPNCLGVELLKVSDIGFAGATVDWQYKGGVNDAMIALSKSNVFDESTLILLDTVRNSSTYQLPALEASTDYYVFVQQLCGANEVSSMSSVQFHSPYGVRYAPVFASTTDSKTEWRSATSGTSAEAAVANGAKLTTLSGWSLATAAISNVHFMSNLYGSSAMKWLVSPAIDLGPNAKDGVTLTFDAALTAYSYSDDVQPADPDMEDDRMVVLACVDDSVWTKVAEWNNLGTGDYRLDALTTTPQSFRLDFSQFAGKNNVRLAFYGESTVYNADNNLHVGNIVLDRMDAVNYIGDICEGLDYDGAAEGNPFYIHTSEYKLGDNRFVKYVGDTVCILSLTVYPNESEEYSVTVCEGDSYKDEYFDLPNITLQTETEQKNKNAVTEHGCVMSVIMHLTINPKQRVTEQQTICPGDTLTWNELTITAPGNYTFEAKTVNGCDSIVTLAVKWGESTEETRDTLLHVGETMTLSDGRVISEAGKYDEEVKVEGACSHTIHWNVTYEETALDAILDEEGVTKMVINNHVVIIRNGVIYSVEGTRLN